VYCPKCQNISLDGNFCESCGTKTILSKFECPHCHATNYVIDDFCKHCGRPIQEYANKFIEEQKESLN